MKRIIAPVAAFVVGAALWSVPLAGADHADEEITVTPTTDLNDGDTVKVSIAGFDPAGVPVKVVTAGQGELVTIPDKLNFEEYATAPEITVAADGTGSLDDYLVYADHGVGQDGEPLNCATQQCWIVAVQEPFLPQPNYASQTIFFAGGSVTPPAETATTAAPATTTTEATTTTTEATTTTTEAKASEESEDDSNPGLLIAAIAAAVALAGTGAYFATRRKGEDELDDGPPVDAGGPAAS